MTEESYKLDYRLKYCWIPHNFKSLSAARNAIFTKK